MSYTKEELANKAWNRVANCVHCGAYGRTWGNTGRFVCDACLQKGLK